MDEDRPAGLDDHKQSGRESSDGRAQIRPQAQARPGAMLAGGGGLRQGLQLRIHGFAQADDAAVVAVNLCRQGMGLTWRVMGVTDSVLHDRAMAVRSVAVGQVAASLRCTPCPGVARHQLQQHGKKQCPDSTAHVQMIKPMKKAPRGFAGLREPWTPAHVRSDRRRAYMPMPPMPPMSGMAGAAASALGASETMHSVVSIRLATEAAFCRAVRVTLVGSRIPISIMSP